MFAHVLAVLFPGTRFPRCRKPSVHGKRIRPQVEQLEDRVTPSLLGLFELDGNVTSGVLGLSGSTTRSHDWDQVFAEAGSPVTSGNFTQGTVSGATAGAFVTDTVNSNTDDIFTGGGSKDTQGIQSGRWLSTGSKPQGKDDITHAYAALYTDLSTGHLIIYAGMDRFDNSGDSTAGFWLLRNPIGETTGVPINGGHPFTGSHTDGDILLVSDFTVGGSISTIKVFRWTGDDSTGNLVALNNGNPISINTFAIVNSGTITVPWSYTNKSGQAHPAAGEFLEEGVDLTALGLDNSFASFLAETRSSQSPTATLSDLVIGNFPQPSESLAATPFVTLSAVGQSVTYPLTVTNTGAVPLYVQNVSDTLLGNIVVNGVVQAPAGAVTNIDASGLSADGSLAPGATVTIFVTRTVQPTDLNPTLNTVTFVFNDRSDLTGNQVTAQTTDQVNLATFAGFLDFLTSTGGVSNDGIANALAKKATHAADKYDAGDYSAAQGDLGAFINQVQAQRGKFITEAAADQLLEYASLLLTLLP
jgi:hypothetical protein